MLTGRKMTTEMSVFSYVRISGHFASAVACLAFICHCLVCSRPQHPRTLCEFGRDELLCYTSMQAKEHSLYRLYSMIHWNEYVKYRWVTNVIALIMSPLTPSNRFSKSVLRKDNPSFNVLMTMLQSAV